MKQADVLRVLADELKTSDLIEINKRLREKSARTLKFKIMGKSLGYLGYTVAIKAVTAEGVKIFDVNKVKLIRFAEIESFAKAKPKTLRPDAAKKVVRQAEATAKKAVPKKSKVEIPEITTKPPVQHSSLYIPSGAAAKTHSRRR